MDVNELFAVDSEEFNNYVNGSDLQHRVTMPGDQQNRQPQSSAVHDGDSRSLQTGRMISSSATHTSGSGGRHNIIRLSANETTA